MRKISISFILVFCTLLGWTQTPDSNLTKKYLLNFSIPDNPAFNALGTNPSNILRPSDIQKFSAMLAPFYSNGQAVIPKNFALEFAPWKLASQNWSLADYSNGINSFLYNSAFSIGTVKDTGAFGTKISIGYRFSYQSPKGDVLKDGLKEIINYQAQTISASKDMIDHWLADVKGKDLRSSGRDDADKYFKAHFNEFNSYIDSLKKLKNNAKMDTNVKKRLKNYLNYNGTPDFKNISMKIDSLIAAYKKKYWNAGRFDFACAWVGESSDSLLKNTRFSSFNAWLTASFRLGNSGQFLVGGSAVLPRSEKTPQNDTSKMSFTGNLRLYEGTSDVRGFIESQYKYQNFGGFKNSMLFNLGAEFRMGTFWVIASSGINNYLTEKNPISKFIANIDLRYSFNK